MSKAITIPARGKAHADHHGHAAPRKPMGERFTALLLQWASDRRPKAAKPRKEMTEDELRAWKAGRNRRRRRKAKALKAARAVAAGTGRKPPKPNTCRRRRLAARHPERKGTRK